jgi:hypothetical protein
LLDVCLFVVLTHLSNSKLCDGDDGEISLHTSPVSKRLRY